MTKEEKIKEAWNKLLPFKPKGGYSLIDGYSNELYHEVQDAIDYNFFDYEKVTINSGKIRPKSLKGIENNNGWNSMEQPDFEENEYVLFLRFIDGEGEPPIFTCVLCDDFEIGYFTHWKRVDYEKPPIF